MSSGSFRPRLGEGAQPPQFCGHLYDYFGKYNMQISDIFAFPNFRKVGKFAAFIERPNTTSASASEGFCPSDSLTRGFALPLNPTGGFAPRSLL